MARRRRGGRAPRRGRRCTAPVVGSGSRGRASRRPSRPRQGRVRPPTGGGNHVSAGSTSLDDSSGRGSPAHSGAGRTGSSWCSRVWGSAPVVPARAAEVPGRRRSRAAYGRPRVRRYPLPMLEQAQADARTPAASIGWAGRCATCGSRSPTAATSAARTACRPRSSGATTSSCRATRSCSYEEIHRLAAVFVGLGVRKLRITGGEPTVRRGLPDLIAMLAALRTPGRRAARPRADDERLGAPGPRAPARRRRPAPGHGLARLARRRDRSGG